MLLDRKHRKCSYLVGGNVLSKVNIDLLKEGSNELRRIKDGKGGLNLRGRIDAAKALQHIDSLTGHFEDLENKNQTPKK